jgi:hypothetical protein
MLTQHPKGQLYSKHEQNKETKQTDTSKQQTKQGNLYHLDKNNSSIGAVTLNNVRREKYTHSSRTR